MRNLRSSLCYSVASTLTAICVTTICAATLSFAEAPDRIAGTIDSSKMVPLSYPVQRSAQPQYDQGRVDGSFQLNNVKLAIVPSASQVKALKHLLEEQQDPKSPNFHKWLTPQQYADRFGLSQNDVLKISAWLKSQGLTVGKVANGRDWINFSGTASQVESTFRTEIHRYNVNGEMHFANSTPPSVPAALSGIANGFLGLDDFRPKPMIKKAVPRARNARPGYYDAQTGTTDFLAPNDIATIYDLGPLYTAGMDGTGQRLAIMGQTDVYLADLVNFRSGFSLPALYSGCTATNGVLTSCTASSTANFQYTLDPNGGGDPGVSTNDLSEADLDLEWSAATARGAQIIFFNSTNVFTSLLDAIDTTPLVAPVMSISYGNCEAALASYILTSAGPGLLETGMMEASSLGITILNSSGDSGATECDPPQPPAVDVNNLANYGLAVSYPASSPEVTGVGGTAIVYPTGFSSTYWNTNDSANNGGTAQNPPLPETAWNDDVELTLVSTSCSSPAETVQVNCGIIQSGGGVSNCALRNGTADSCGSGFSVPTWQSALSFPTAPPTTGRYSPDVSLLASPNFPGYVYCTPVEELSTDPTYDTSPASSCASGIPAAVNGVVSGQSYLVDPSVVGGTSASAPIFAGMVTILNQVLNGASTAGLGNINPKLYQLAATPGAFHHVVTGDNMVYCSGDTPNPSYEINAAYLCPGATGSTGIFGWNASNADSTTGYNLVTGLGSVDANALFTAWQASLGSFTLAANPTSISVIAGNTSGSTTITLAPSVAPPFNTPVTYYCSTGTVVGTTCVFAPSTATLNPVTLTIATAASMKTGPITVTVSATGGGVTASTTVTLNVSATNQSFQLAQSGSATLQVNPGQTGTATIAVTQPTNGFNTPLTFTCSETTAPMLSASGSVCTVAPANPTAGPVTVNITTVAPTAQMHPPLGTGRGIFFAALLPGLLGIVFTAGSRKRAARGLRFLSLIVVLSFSTLWLASCSSNSSSTHNPGTPAGSYPVTINATTGGVNPLTGSVTVTLVVQ
jgi:subtilase family serine protease